MKNLITIYFLCVSYILICQNSIDTMRDYNWVLGSGAGTNGLISFQNGAIQIDSIIPTIRFLDMRYYLHIQEKSEKFANIFYLCVTERGLSAILLHGSSSSTATVFMVAVFCFLVLLFSPLCNGKRSFCSFMLEVCS